MFVTQDAFPGREPVTGFLDAAWAEDTERSMPNEPSLMPHYCTEHGSSTQQLYSTFHERRNLLINCVKSCILFSKLL